MTTKPAAGSSPGSYSAAGCGDRRARVADAPGHHRKPLVQPRGRSPGGSRPHALSGMALQPVSPLPVRAETVTRGAPFSCGNRRSNDSRSSFQLFGLSSGRGPICSRRRPRRPSSPRRNRRCRSCCSKGTPIQKHHHHLGENARRAARRRPTAFRPYPSPAPFAHAGGVENAHQGAHEIGGDADQIAGDAGLVRSKAGPRPGSC